MPSESDTTITWSPFFLPFPVFDIPSLCPTSSTISPATIANEWSRSLIWSSKSKPFLVPLSASFCTSALVFNTSAMPDTTVTSSLTGSVTVSYTHLTLPTICSV